MTNKSGQRSAVPITNPGGASRGASADELRRHNLSTVLDRVHLDGPVSRSELATVTGLNRSTIGHLVAQLTELGLTVEGGGTASGGRGRPSAVVEPRPEGAVVVAVELEVDFTAVATIGLGGHVFDRVRAPVAGGPEADPQAVVAGVGALARPLLERLPPDHRLVGLGAAAAGMVRRRDGHIELSPNQGWADVPLSELLSAEFGLDRVRLANEADVGALGELRRGAARGVADVLYISGEVGVGLGVIVDGVPVSGVSGYAGEAGHMTINPEGRPCRCGSVGCWETEVGEEALARRAGIPSDGDRQTLAEEVLRRAHGGDRSVFDAFHHIGRWLGLGVANLVNIFNPELVLFGGFYHPLFPFLEQPLTDQARRSTLPAPWSACTVGQAGLGLDSRLLGAAELVLAEIIADPAELGR